MKFHLWVWKMCGVWHPPDDGQPSHRYWYLVYSIVLNAIFFFLFPFFIAVQLIWANSMREFVEIVLILPTTMVGLKSLLIIRNQSKLLRVFELLDRMDGMLKFEDEKQVIRDAVSGSRILVAALSCEYYVSIVAFFVVAVMMEGRVLMWASWYPLLDYRNVSAIYYSLMAYQLVGSLCVGFTSASMDVYGLALYRLLRAHLNVLGSQLSQLGNGAMDKRVSVTKKHIICERELFRCIEYHSLCIR